MTRFALTHDEQEDVLHMMYNAHMWAQYGGPPEDSVPRWHLWRPAVVVAVVWQARVWGPLMTVVCRRKGHKLVDAGSYAGPNSGAEYLHCTRCHADFTHIYY